MKRNLVGVLVLVLVAGVALFVARGDGGGSRTVRSSSVAYYCHSLGASLEREAVLIDKRKGVVQFRTGQQGTLYLLSIERAFAMCVNARGGDSALVDQFLDAAMDLGEAQIVADNDKGIAMLRKMIELTRQMEALY